MNKEQITSICIKVREVLEVFSRTAQAKHYYFADFPKGCCGATTNILGHILHSYDSSGLFEYVCREDEKTTHAWLEYNGLVIDITADQFEECTEKVIVTSDKSFYNRFWIDNLRKRIAESEMNYEEKYVLMYVIQNMK